MWDLSGRLAMGALCGLILSNRFSLLAAFILVPIVDAQVGAVTDHAGSGIGLA